jgi:hypothetical protein
VKKYQLNENLRINELIDLVNPLVEIDRYKPKIGNDADTVVVAFKVDSFDAATDLSAYLEWSPSNSISDVEVSDASDNDGKFHVYIELKRLPGLNNNIITIIKDIEHVTGPQEWKFIGMDGKREDLDINSLNYKIIQNPKLYALPPDSRDWYMRIKTLTKY